MHRHNNVINFDVGSNVISILCMVLFVNLSNLFKVYMLKRLLKGLKIFACRCGLTYYVLNTDGKPDYYCCGYFHLAAASASAFELSCPRNRYVRA